jgi:hypothetical protein
MNPQISISVVIPTVRGMFPKRGKLADLIKPLQSKLRLSEIIVAGCWDAAFLTGKLSVPIVRISTRTFERSYLRNVALKRCSGTHVLFLDDDTIPLVSNAFLKQLNELPEGAMLTMATRRYVNIGLDLSETLKRLRRVNWNRHCARHLPVYHRDDEVYAAGITFCSNFGIADRKSILRIGGFDESFRGWGFEDVDFMNMMLKHGPIISCHRTATAIHIDHLVQPDRLDQARLNHKIAARKYQADSSIPHFSSTFYGIAAKFVDRIDPCRRPTKTILGQRLAVTAHFAKWRDDIEPAAALFLRVATSADLLAITIHGSATTAANYRDIDMCAITGSGRDYFKVLELPSGHKLEVHIAPLYAIRRHLNWLKYHPETAFLNWSKWGSMQFLYDSQDIVARFLSETMKYNRNAVPFMMSFCVGEAWTLLHKRSPLDQMAAARHVAAVAQLSGISSPTALLETQRMKEWLRNACARLGAMYRGLVKLSDKKEVLVYPANMVGHRMLCDAPANVKYASPYLRLTGDNTRNGH